MQKIAVIQISEAGSRIASTLQRQLNAKIIRRADVGAEWGRQDAFVFIGAMGICVRTIAPFVQDKHQDPAVVCIDSLGQNVISVLSGHIGGANELTQTISGILGAHQVITTQSDGAGLWALDTFQKRFDWSLASDNDEQNRCIFAFVNRQPTALLLEVYDRGTGYLEATKPGHVTIISDISQADPQRFRLLIIVSLYMRSAPEGMLVLRFVPMVGTIGFGLSRHPDDYRAVYDEINDALAGQGILPCTRKYCTIDVKQDEEFCAMLRDETGKEVVFYNAGELAAIQVLIPAIPS